MSKTKFTQGPWKVADDVLFNVRSIRIRAADYPWLLAKVADTTQVHILKAAKQDMDWNVFEANAALIAAAPEMYAMLETLLNDYEEGSIVHGQISALLAKARGE